MMTNDAEYIKMREERWRSEERIDLRALGPNLGEGRGRAERRRRKEIEKEEERKRKGREGSRDWRRRGSFPVTHHPLLTPPVNLS